MSTRRRFPTAGERLFATALALVAVVATCNLLSARRSVASAAAAHAAAAGSARDVDPVLIRRLIQEGKLSEHEADHYRKLGQERADAGAH